METALLEAVKGVTGRFAVDLGELLREHALMR
jgi:hypothetical protein